MVMETDRVIDTEVERELVSVMVNEAFRSWSRDSTNEEAVLRMNYALNEAYGTGVPISVKITREAKESPLVVNQKVYERLKEIDRRIQDEIVLSTVQDNPRSSRIYSGKVITGMSSGFLSLDVITGRKRLNIATLKPNEISLFSPISPPR